MKRKYLLLPALFFAFVVVTFVAFSASAAGACSASMSKGDAREEGRMFVANGEIFAAELRGDMEVPSANTDARGEAMFLFDKESNTLRYALRVENMDNVTAAHIHMGSEGQNGEVVVALTTSPQGGVTEGTITAADLKGPMAGKTLADLDAEIERGNMYVNVHSTDFPNGEIRGQLREMSR